MAKLQTLMSAAKGEYESADKPPYYPKLELSKPEQKFDALWNAIAFRLCGEILMNHTADLHLRHTRFIALRDDKTATDVRRGSPTL